MSKARLLELLHRAASLKCMPAELEEIHIEILAACFSQQKQNMSAILFLDSLFVKAVNERYEYSVYNPNRVIALFKDLSVLCDDVSTASLCVAKQSA